MINPDGHHPFWAGVRLLLKKETENDANTETVFCARRLEAIQGWPDPVLVVYDHGAVCGMPASG